MTPRTEASLHDHHHGLIDERTAALAALGGRSGLHRLRRREAAKLLIWTLKGHLRWPHGHRCGPFDTLDEMEAAHARLHSAEARS